MMAKYGRGAVSAQLTSAVERISSTNSLSFKDALASKHLADEFAAASPDSRERIFSPSDDTARLYGAGTML